MDEMNKVKEPFRLVAYPDAVHAFTNPEAGSDPAQRHGLQPAGGEAAYGEMTAFFTSFSGSKLGVGSRRANPLNSPQVRRVAEFQRIFALCVPRRIDNFRGGT